LLAYYKHGESKAIQVPPLTIHHARPKKMMFVLLKDVAVPQNVRSSFHAVLLTMLVQEYKLSTPELSITIDVITDWVFMYVLYRNMHQRRGLQDPSNK
jgi:hypothetical protein